MQCTSPVCMPVQPEIWKDCVQSIVHREHIDLTAGSRPKPRLFKFRIDKYKAPGNSATWHTEILQEDDPSPYDSTSGRSVVTYTVSPSALAAYTKLRYIQSNVFRTVLHSHSQTVYLLSDLTSDFLLRGLILMSGLAGRRFWNTHFVYLNCCREAKISLC